MKFFQDNKKPCNLGHVPTSSFSTKLYKNEELKTYEIDIYSTGSNENYKACKAG